MIDGFEFQDDFVANDHVRAETALHRDPVIFEWYFDLALVRNLVTVQFQAQASFIHAFQQSWAEAGVDAHREADDLAAEACVMSESHGGMMGRAG